MSNVDRIAHHLAFKYAKGIIEDFAMIAAQDAHEWFDLSDEDDRAELSEELDYLEARGLVIHHPNQKWIRIPAQPGEPQ